MADKEQLWVVGDGMDLNDRQSTGTADKAEQSTKQQRLHKFTFHVHLLSFVGQAAGLRIPAFSLCFRYTLF